MSNVSVSSEGLVVGTNSTSTEERESSLFDLVPEGVLDDLIEQYDAMGKGAIFRDYVKCYTDSIGAGRIRRGQLEWIFSRVMNDVPTHIAGDMPAYIRS